MSFDINATEVDLEFDGGEHLESQISWLRLFKSLVFKVVYRSVLVPKIHLKLHAGTHKICKS